MNFDYLFNLVRKGAIDIHLGGRRAALALLDALDLHSGGCVLEIGSGTGDMIGRVLQNLPLRIVGGDVLPKILPAARGRFNFAGVSECAYLAQSNVAALSFHEGSFVRTFAESVIGFQETQVIQLILAEIHRVLKSKGLFILQKI